MFYKITLYTGYTCILLPDPHTTNLGPYFYLFFRISSKFKKDNYKSLLSPVKQACIFLVFDFIFINQLQLQYIDNTVTVDSFLV